MKTKYFVIFSAIVCLFLLSCAKSPANTLVGKYEGTFVIDSATSGAATVTVVEVNSLTVNFMVELQSMFNFQLNDVAVNGGDEPYNLFYTGIYGDMTGTATKTDMTWTLYDSNDTTVFVGTKPN